MFSKRPATRITCRRLRRSWPGSFAIRAAMRTHLTLTETAEAASADDDLDSQALWRSTRAPILARAGQLAAGGRTREDRSGVCASDRSACAAGRRTVGSRGGAATGREDGRGAGGDRRGDPAATPPRETSCQPGGAKKWPRDSSSLGLIFSASAVAGRDRCLVHHSIPKRPFLVLMICHSKSPSRSAVQPGTPRFR